MLRSTLSRVAAGAVLGVLLAAGATGTARAETPSIRQITIWDDDPARGAATCREYVADWAPATCEVRPASMAPDVTAPGWAY